MYLFFDTETTGLPLNRNARVGELDNWPRIVEIAWILTDKSGKELEAETMILKPDDFQIPYSISAIHGITDAIANEKGKDRITVLNQFASLLDKANILIAHNISFDKKIVHSEFMRYNIKSTIHRIDKLCTKELTTDYCKLPGKYSYKWPTLEELYKKVFKIKLTSHSAFGDVKACKDCFFELVNRGVIKLYGSKVLVDTVIGVDDDEIIQVDEIDYTITDNDDFKYFTRVRHLGLNECKSLKAKDEWVLEERIEKQIERFNAKWERVKPKLKNHHFRQANLLEAEYKINEAINQIKQLETIFQQTINKTKKPNQKETNQLNQIQGKYIQNKLDSKSNFNSRNSEYFQKNPYSIIENCDSVLSSSEYPEYLQKAYELGYNPKTEFLIDVVQ